MPICKDKKMKSKTHNIKKCVLCGCKDHRLIGCIIHVAKKCSCKSK